MKFFVVILCLVISSATYGQKFGYAVKVGGGISTQKFDNKDVISTNSINTFNIGGLIKYYLPHQYFIQTGINIANKGAEVVEDGITTTPRITYLEIPVTFDRKFKLNGLGSLYAGAGGYIGSALRGHYNFQTPSSSTSEKLEFGSEKDLNRYDAGLNFSTGLEVDNGLLFDIRYALGLKNIASQPARDTGTNGIYNRLFCVSIGYVFK